MLSVFFVFAFLFNSNKTQAQCAGTDSSITICDTTIPANQTINLFSLLGGIPTPGGTWSVTPFAGGLNPITGVVNVLQIRESDVFTYTYTVTGVSGCADNTADVMVTIGGYAGVPKGGSKCADLTTLNLFELFNYEFPNLPPHTNGTWFNVTTGMPITGSTINPSSYNITVQTDYVLSYTMPAIGSCPASTVNMVLTLFPPVEPGTTVPLELCSTENLSLYSNIDLFTLLTGEDAGGVWTDTSAPITGEISGSDTTINVQNIYNNFGAGTYTFTYKVFASPPVCKDETATVTVVIEDPIDYSGTILNVSSDICESEIAIATYTGQLTQNPILIPNGTYDITYNVDGGAPVTTSVTFTNGVSTPFSIPSSNFQTLGTFVVTVTNIVATTSLGICINPVAIAPDTITISPQPVAINAVLTVGDTCQGSDASAQLSGVSNLADGPYTITYTLSALNTGTYTANINVVGGISNFVIPGTVLGTSGTTTATITTIANNTTTCSATVNIPPDSFEVNPLPVVSALTLTVGDTCLNQPVTVTIGGLGTLSNITINYDLTGVNNSVNNSVSVALIAGSGTFVIPQILLTNIGTTSITVTNVINTGNSCATVVSAFPPRSFTINDIPVAPTTSNQNFCETDNATVANLTPSGNLINWYDSPTSTTPLPVGTVLASGNYYVSQTNNTTSCESPRTMITVVVDVVAAPTLTTNGQNFCGADLPTIQQLSDNTTSGTQ